MSFLNDISEGPSKPFKLFFWRFFFGCLPIVLLSSFLALLEIRPFIFNEQPIYGIKGFMLNLVFMPFPVLAADLVILRRQYFMRGK